MPDSEKPPVRAVTVKLPIPLIQEAKIVAIRAGTTFQDLVAAALERYIAKGKAK
jgi:hypothetical protein